MFALIVLVGAMVVAPRVIQAPPRSVDDFATSDLAGKRRILNDIAASRSRVPIEQVIQLIRAAMRDPLADVRLSAMAAVGGRAMASRWAGTPGPRSGPGPRNSVQPERGVIPLEWKDDQQKLRDALSEGLLALLRRDPDPTVRHDTLIAIGYLEWPAGTDDLIRDEFVAVLIERYRQDADPRVRAEVVKAFRLTPNDSAAIRAVLRDALVDPAESVRHGATSILTAQGLGARPKLSFEDARPTILTSIKHPDGSVRVAAVRALNAFGAAAADYVPVLRQLINTDPDPQVRTSAELARQGPEQPSSTGPITVRAPNKRVKLTPHPRIEAAATIVMPRSLRAVR
jgi:HEAT repeat protein